MAYSIKITKAAQSKVSEVDFSNIPFGKIFSDHIFVADYDGKQWTNLEIKPLEKMPLHPATMAWHYGQAIFEGMKAGKSADGVPLLFRPQLHAQRMNASARRMCMPEIPEDLFIQALEQLLLIDKDWIPTQSDSALYLRPVMMATDEFIGVRSSETFRFMILALPSGPYYNKPVGLWVEEHFVRAADGGVGEAKAAGNYGAALYPTKLARDKGYDQVMWMDAREFKYVQESGTMNVFFLTKNAVLTPNLSGTILRGITRDSIIQILSDNGYKVEERAVSIDEIIEAHTKGELLEVFGTGTAAVIAQINRIGYHGKDYHINAPEDGVAAMLKSSINGIRQGRLQDKHDWVWPVEQKSAVLA